MGGGHSVQNIQESINTAVTNIITNTLQEVSTDVNTNQTLVVDCKQYNTDVLNYVSTCTETFKLRSVDDILRLCDTTKYVSCGATNIDMKNSINLNMTVDQKSKIEISLQNNLDTKLKSSIETSTGLLQFGNSTKSSMKSLNTVVTNIIKVKKQSIIDTLGTKQNIYISNGNLSLVTIENTTDVIQSVFQNEDEYTKAVTALSTAIMSDIKSSSMFNFNILYIILGSILGSLVGILFFLWLYRKLSQKKRENLLVVNSFKPILESMVG